MTDKQALIIGAAIIIGACIIGHHINTLAVYINESILYLARFL